MSIIVDLQIRDNSEEWAGRLREKLAEVGDEVRRFSARVSFLGALLEFPGLERTEIAFERLFFVMTRDAVRARIAFEELADEQVRGARLAQEQIESLNQELDRLEQHEQQTGQSSQSRWKSFADNIAFTKDAVGAVVNAVQTAWGWVRKLADHGVIGFQKLAEAGGRFQTALLEIGKHPVFQQLAEDLAKIIDDLIIPGMRKMATFIADTIGAVQQGVANVIGGLLSVGAKLGIVTEEFRRAYEEEGRLRAQAAARREKDQARQAAEARQAQVRDQQAKVDAAVNKVDVLRRDRQQQQAVAARNDGGELLQEVERLRRELKADAARLQQAGRDPLRDDEWQRKQRLMEDLERRRFQLEDELDRQNREERQRREQAEQAQRAAAAQAEQEQQLHHHQAVQEVREKQAAAQLEAIHRRQAAEKAASEAEINGIRAILEAKQQGPGRGQSHNFIERIRGSFRGPAISRKVLERRQRAAQLAAKKRLRARGVVDDAGRPAGDTFDDLHANQRRINQEMNRARDETRRGFFRDRRQGAIGNVETEQAVGELTGNVVHFIAGQNQVNGPVKAALQASATSLQQQREMLARQADQTREVAVQIQQAARAALQVRDQQQATRQSLDEAWRVLNALSGRGSNANTRAQLTAGAR